MLSPISTILHRAARSGRKYNVITAPTHERYQSNLANTNANYYMIQNRHTKDWKTEYAPIPDNHILLKLDDIKNLPINIQFDFVLSQNKFGQFQFLHQIARMLHLPIISLEHTLPLKNWDENVINQLKILRGDMNLFISEYSREKWGWNENEADVIHHGIDTELFKPNENIERKNVLLSVCNDWINRDEPCGFNVWRRVSNGLQVDVVGNTPGLSLPTKNTAELVNKYQSSSIFLNTSLISPIPTSLLEAASCGCAIVSTATCMIPEIIENGLNGFISNDESELRKRCIELLNNPEMAKKMGENARKTVIEKFGLEKFTENWNNILERGANLIYRI